MILSADEIKRYKDTGLIFPQRVMTTDDAANYLAELEAYETNSGGPINGKWRYKSHLVFSWFDQLMRHPAILELVRPILGDDLMVWTTHIYPKEPGDGRFISWHQDSAHWGLDSNQVLTVWVALTNATRENGCMRMLPGSHHNGQVEHQDTRDRKNFLTRGQTILNGIDEDQSVWVELKAGEVSIHHVDMFHASTPNRSGQRRVG
ncbi:MAG: phytanoyl-CoA dioxygenase family protein, partial [Pseudomonadota bacterium]|nr:phytanoyl-CoA dioxygenase family protein [Pseudomonadota bacterium]